MCIRDRVDGQNQGSAVRALEDLMARCAPGQRPAVIGVNSVTTTYTPVSYTHLDVYKRQHLHLDEAAVVHKTHLLLAVRLAAEHIERIRLCQRLHIFGLRPADRAGRQLAGLFLCLLYTSSTIELRMHKLPLSQ